MDPPSRTELERANPQLLCRSAGIRIVEQIETATGVDILRGLGDNGSQPTLATLPEDA